MPKLGLTMTEGLLTEWRVGPRQRVQPGDILFVVETDKIANEVEAQAEGVIDEILVPAGKVVPVGALLARWTNDGGASSPTMRHPSPAPPPSPPRSNSAAGGRAIATPLARRLAREHGIDIHAIAGSGPRGRVKAQDVLAAKPTSAGITTSAAEPASPGARTSSRRRAATSYEAAIATRLTAAKRNVPHFYVATEADIGGLLRLRDELNADSARPRISINHMLVLALARAVAETPKANRAWRDGEVEEFATVDIGIAVDTERGLFVPVLRDAAALPLDTIVALVAGLVERARAGTLSLDETSGGAVTISNVGMHRITYLTPIINPGQTAILGVGGVRETFRPDDAGAPRLRREIGLVLACDHRVLDGVAAAAFLNQITGYVEKPLRLLRTAGGG